jgi:hypothetical protein
MEIERSKNHALSPESVPRIRSVLETLCDQMSGKRGEYLQWFRQCKVADPADEKELDVTWRVRRAIFEKNGNIPVWESQIKRMVEKGVYCESIIDLEDDGDVDQYLWPFVPQGVVQKTRFSFDPAVLAIMAEAIPKKTRPPLPDIKGVSQLDFDIVHNPATRMLIDPRGRVIRPSEGLRPQLLPKSPFDGYKLVKGVLFREEQEFKNVEAMKECDIEAIRRVTKAYFATQRVPLQPNNDGQRSAARRIFSRYANTALQDPSTYFYQKDATPTQRGKFIMRTLGLGHIIRNPALELLRAA